MKITSFTFMFMAFFIGFFMGCNDDNDTASGSIEIIGAIYNDPAAEIPEGAASKLTNQINTLIPSSCCSTLTDITDAERFPDISAGEFIVVDTTIINDGDVDLVDLSLEIMAEDASLLTPERWTCWQCFPHGDTGGSCNGVWEVYGGTIIDPIESEPALPGCEEVEPPYLTGTCYDTFPEEVDCENPFWYVDYEGPGDGLWRGWVPIKSLPVNESFSVSNGMAHTGIDVRPDHFARWIVKDSNGVILAQKDYVFNVTP